MQFDCLIEEYNVENKKRDEWYSSSAEDIFYLHPYPVEMSDLRNYFENPDVIKKISNEMHH
jgi:hypothetical protein